MALSLQLESHQALVFRRVEAAAQTLDFSTMKSYFQKSLRNNVRDQSSQVGVGGGVSQSWLSDELLIKEKER
jgi:hypothetical protein